MSDDAATFRRIPLEIFSEGSLALIDEVFADDYVEHHELPPGFPPGRDAVRTIVAMMRAAFPDLRYEVLQQFQDADFHIGRVRASGTMTGEFMGMAPTGKSASWDEVHIGRMAGGKLAEHWGVDDQLSMFQQLGLVPPPSGS